MSLKNLTAKRAVRLGRAPEPSIRFNELRHRQKAHIVIRPAEEADPKELERLILDVQMTHPEEAIRVDFEFSDDRSFRVRLPCPYKAAADWTLVRDLEDSPSIQQVEVAYGLYLRPPELREIQVFRLSTIHNSKKSQEKVRKPFLVTRFLVLFDNQGEIRPYKSTTDGRIGRALR